MHVVKSHQIFGGVSRSEGHIYHCILQRFAKASDALFQFINPKAWVVALTAATAFFPTDENFVIAAFGDDPTTIATDGFVSGQPYTWFIRINNSEDPLDGWTDYIGENIVMDDSNGFIADYDNGALSNLLSIDFVLYSEWTNCMDLSACNYNQAATSSVLEECEYTEQSVNRLR